MPNKKGPKEGDLVMVSCRASADCEGQQAKIIFIKPYYMGNRVTRYQCMTCKRPFHITV